MSKVIGIDLGSTLSEVAVFENGTPTVVPNEDGSYTTPSVVSINNEERKVGSSAKRQQIVNPKNTVYLIKRFMGSTFEESDAAIKHVQYDVVNEGGKPRVKIGDRTFSPEEISSYILGKMKKIAEDYLGQEVTDAVITVPAFFNDAARQATKTAGELAGLKVLRVIAEPTAAILSSNIDMEKGGKYMVVDFGGSTLDNSVADIGDRMVEILSTNGDVYLGGSDIDKLVADYVVREFNDVNGIDLSKDAHAMTRILEAVEKAKIELSSSSSTDLNVPYVSVKNNTPLHLNMQLSRAKFEQLIKPIVDKLIGCARKAIELAKIEAKDLDGILLIGGSCRIPLVQEELTKAFGVTLLKSSNMDLAVAEGAAIQANSIVGGEGSTDILLVDVTPISLGIETLGGVMTKLIDANSTIPCTRRQVFSTAENNQTTVTVHVLQGERPMAKDNKSIGQFNLDGIMPAPRGIPQIEVTFDIDANGILNVSAKDKATGKEQAIRIEGSNKLSEDEINRIKAEAEKFADADKKAKEEADAVNKGEGIIFAQEKLIKEQEGNLTSDEKTTLEGLVNSLRDAVKAKDVAKINELETSINNKWNEISQRVYQGQGQQQQEEPQETAEDVATSASDDVQEADFEEVN